MKVSELIEDLQNVLQNHGDIDVVVHDTLTEEFCTVEFDDQVMVSKTPEQPDPVMAFSPTGDYSRWNHYSA